MGSKLLAGVGVLAILGLVVGSIAALLVVKDRIRVTIAEESAAANRAPDPVELLRADLVVLAGDLAAVNGNLGAGFEQLHASLESAAGEREQRLSARVDALEATLSAMQADATQNRAAAAAEIAALVDSIAQVKLQAASVPVQAAEASPPVVTESPTEVAMPQALEIAPAPALPPPPASPRKEGFLAFQLPSSVFAFDQRQRFAIVPALSRVGFDAKSTLHDFSGVTSKVDGHFSVNLAKADEKPIGKISVDAAALDSGQADRDVDMRKTLAVEQFKSITFEWTGFAVSGVDPKALTVAGSAVGKLSIRGVTKEVSMPVKVSVDASKRVAIDGELEILLSDYGVAPPTQLGGTIQVDDELKLWIALRARLVGKAKDGE